MKRWIYDEFKVDIMDESMKLNDYKMCKGIT